MDSAVVGNEDRAVTEVQTGGGQTLMLPVTSRLGAALDTPVKISAPAWVRFGDESSRESDADFYGAEGDIGAKSCPAGRLRKRKEGFAEQDVFDFGGRDADWAGLQKVGVAKPGSSTKIMDACTSLLPLVPPGLAPPPGTPSHGSILHGIGVCKPCAWFWKPSGCQNGADCMHCHSCPQGEIKARKKNKDTMLRLGLATPKLAELEESHNLSFCFEKAGTGYDREPEVSTTCSMSEREVMTDPPSEDDSSSGPIDKEIDTKAVNAIQNESLKIEISLLGILDRIAGEGLQDRSHCGVQWTSSECSTNERSCGKVEASVESSEDSSSSYRPQPAARLDDSLPSVGSALHMTGSCRPCGWYWKKGGCQNGRECYHCHLCPEGEIKARRKTKAAVVRVGLSAPRESPEI